VDQRPITVTSEIAQDAAPRPLAIRWAWLFVLLMVLTSGWQAWDSYQAAVRAAQTLATALARVAEERIIGSLRSVDTLLRDLIGQVPDVEHVDASALDAYLGVRLMSFPELRGIALIAPQGLMSYYSFHNTPGVDLSDRPHFLSQRDNYRLDRLEISEPQIDRVTNNYSIFATRPLLSEDKAFRGVASAVVLPEFFEGVLRSQAAVCLCEALIVSSQGAVVARFPGSGGAIGSRLSEDSSLSSHLAGAARGVYSEVGTDGESRIVAYRRVPDLSLVVAIGVSAGSALEEWRRSTVTIGGVELLGALVILWLARRADRKETQRREADANLQMTVERLAFSNADLERFAFVASHDLQEPVRNVVSYSQLLVRHCGGKLDPQSEDYLAIIVNGAMRLHALINDMLVFSRLTTTLTPHTDVDCGLVTMAAIESLSGPLVEAGADVAVTTPLPILRGNRLQLMVVLQGLIGNAIKFRARSRPARITVSAERRGDEWEFLVEDNGIGIDPAYADQVFVIFKRLHGHDDYPGTGCGLAVIKRIIENHRGRIWLEPNPLGGSRFHFTLPARPNEPS
jgi:signal transduction histidine kinase